MWSFASIRSCGQRQSHLCLLPCPHFQENWNLSETVSQEKLFSPGPLCQVSWSRSNPKTPHIMQAFHIHSVSFEPQKNMRTVLFQQKSELHPPPKFQLLWAMGNEIPPWCEMSVKDDAHPKLQHGHCLRSNGNSSENGGFKSSLKLWKIWLIFKNVDFCTESFLVTTESSA